MGKINTSINIITYTVFLLGLLFVAIFAFRRPYYNWDMLAYMAIVIKAEHLEFTPEQVHTTTYQIALQEVPQESFNQLTDHNNEYRKRMASNATDFNSRLPFYSVKPLYIGMICLFHSAGFSLVKSTVLPSIICYFLIGLLLAYWLQSYLPFPISCLSALFIMSSTILIGVARNSTPDCLSALVLLSILYIVVQKFRLRTLFFCLLLSLLTRIDNIIPCLSLLSFLVCYKQPGKEISRKNYFIIVAALIILYFGISSLAIYQHSGWSVLYYPDFTHYFNLERTYQQTFSWRSYFALLYSHFFTALVYTHFSLFAFFVLALLGLPKSSRSDGNSFDQYLALVLISVILIRFLLFPDLDDRFNIAFYLTILVLIVKKMNCRHN